MPHKGIKSELKQLEHYQWNYLINLKKLEMYCQKLRLHQHVIPICLCLKLLFIFAMFYQSKQMLLMYLNVTEFFSTIALQLFNNFYTTLAEKAMAPHSSTLAWKIPWTEKPGRLQSMGSLRVGHEWVTSRSLFTFLHWRRKWQPTPIFLPGESQGQRSLEGCHLWGRAELDMT